MVVPSACKYLGMTLPWKNSVASVRKLASHSKCIPILTRAHRLQLLIDGKFVNAKSGKVFGTKDPRTGEQLLEVAEAQAEDVDLAVKAARKVPSAFTIAQCGSHGERERFTSSPTFLCGNTPATLG